MKDLGQLFTSCDKHGETDSDHGTGCLSCHVSEHDRIEKEYGPAGRGHPDKKCFMCASCCGVEVN